MYLRPLPVKWEFPSLGWVKINIDGATRRYLGLATYWEYGGVYWEFLCISLCLGYFGCWVLWSYIWFEEIKIWDLLMYGLNVIMSWFVLHLLLGLLFRGCFVINEIFVLIIMEKSGLWLLIFFVKRMCALISWLI